MRIAEAHYQIRSSFFHQIKLERIGDYMYPEPLMQDNKAERQLDYVVGVSWPRSGYHMLERMLENYFENSFRICLKVRNHEWKEEGAKSNCCDGGICKNHNVVNYCKNHDTKGIVPIVSGYKYLVQYRGFFPSVISSFELDVTKLGRPDTEKRFREFTYRRLKRYNSFMEKWVYSEQNGADILRISYEDLVSDPEGWLRKVVSHFAPHEELDIDKIADIVSNVNQITFVNGKKIHKRKSGVTKSSRRIEEFRFYSPEWFAEVEGQILKKV